AIASTWLADSRRPAGGVSDAGTGIGASDWVVSVPVRALPASPPVLPSVLPRVCALAAAAEALAGTARRASARTDPSTASGRIRRGYRGRSAGGGRDEHLTGGGARQRRPHAPQRVRVFGADQEAALDARSEHRERPLHRPARAARVLDVVAGREAQLAVQGARDDALAGGVVGVALQPHHEVDA